MNLILADRKRWHSLLCEITTARDQFSAMLIVDKYCCPMSFPDRGMVVAMLQTHCFEDSSEHWH